MGYIKKQREPCVLFLEAAFGTDEHPRTLTDVGWTVECFRDHFQDDGGKPLDNVKDPQIIKFCHTQRWVLVTTDRQMRHTHVETIKATTVAIVATVNNKHKPDVWMRALNKAKAKIERHVKKHPRPWFAVLGTEGSLSIETVTPEAFTRRNRPREGQERN